MFYRLNYSPIAMIYIKELRNRFILILFTVTFTFLAAYSYKETILFIIIKPNYLNLNNKNSFYFIFTNVIEIFYVYFQLVWFICFQCLILYLTYHTFVFFCPALSFKEFYFLFHMWIFLILTWGWLVSVLNSLVIPFFWDLCLSFQSLKYSVNLHFEAKLMEYLNFYINLYYLFISYVNIFVFIFFLFYNLMDNLSTLKRLRKAVYFILILASTILSPPDVFNQLILSLVTILIYEFFFFILLVNFYIRQVTDLNQ